MTKFMLLILVSVSTYAANISITGPCSPVPLSNVNVAYYGRVSLGQLTTDYLRRAKIDFQGDASFIDSIIGIPTEKQKVEVIGSVYRVYGWCAKVNNKELVVSIDQYITNSYDHIEWYLGYMENRAGKWSNCVPAYKVKPAMFCQNRNFTSAEEAIGKDHPRIKTWANKVVEFKRGSNLTVNQPLNNALGKAEGDTTTVLSLGDGGEVVLSFPAPINNQDGPDFAVFENGFSPTFLEFAFVEVSSNGKDYARFPGITYNINKIATYGQSNPDDYFMLAGKYQAGIGQGFDLSWLESTPNVLSGVVDLTAIQYVKIIDIVGDGKTLDDNGNPIFDPYPTRSTAGFDLDAIAIL